MFTLPSEPQSIGRTLDAGFKLYFVCFKRAVLPSFLAALTALLPSVGLWLLSTPEGEPDPNALVLLVPLFLVSIAGSFLFYLVLIHRVGIIARREPGSFGASVRVGLRRLFPFIIASILYTLALFGGFLLFVVPGVILGVSLVLYSLCMVFDGDGIFESLHHSHRLVWGHWWRTLLLVSVGMIVYYVLYAAIGAPAVIVDEMAMTEHGGQGVLTLVGELFANTIMFPALIAVFIVVYHDLKLRKEGTDLEARVEALTANT